MYLSICLLTTYSNWCTLEGKREKAWFFASVVVLCAFLCMRIIIIIIIIITFSFMARSRYRFRFRSPMRRWVLLISHKFNITRKDLHAKVSFKICFRPCPSFSDHPPTITHTRQLTEVLSPTRYVQANPNPYFPS